MDSSSLNNVMQFKQGPKTESLEKPHSFPHSKTEIREAFQQIDEQVEALLTEIPDQVLEQSPDAEDSLAAQQLQRMVQRLKPLAFALRLPKWSVRLLGQPQNAPRDYDHLKGVYHEVLEETTDPATATLPRRSAQALYDEWQYLLQKTLKRLQKYWSEQQLNAFSIPHAELGRLSIRENLLLSVYQVKRQVDQMEVQVEQELQLA